MGKAREAKAATDSHRLPQIETSKDWPGSTIERTEPASCVQGEIKRPVGIPTGLFFRRLHCVTSWEPRSVTPAKAGVQSEKRVPQSGANTVELYDTPGYVQSLV